MAVRTQKTEPAGPGPQMIPDRCHIFRTRRISGHRWKVVTLLPPRAKNPDTQDHHKGTVEGRAYGCSLLLAATAHNCKL